MPPWWAFLVIPLSVYCLGACCAAALKECGSSDKPRLEDAATTAEDALCKANQTFLATGVTSVGAATNALQRHGSSVGREYSDVSPFWRPSKPSVGTSSDEPTTSLLGATPSEFEKNAAG